MRDELIACFQKEGIKKGLKLIKAFILKNKWGSK